MIKYINEFVVYIQKANQYEDIMNKVKLRQKGTILILISLAKSPQFDKLKDNKVQNSTIEENQNMNSKLHTNFINIRYQ